MRAHSMIMIAALASGACGRLSFDEHAANGHDAQPPDAGCATCSVGLVAHWTMDDAAGSVARDVVAGHDVTMMGFELGWAEGVRGGAAAVTYGYGIVDWNVVPALAGGFSVAMWQQASSASSAYDRYLGTYYYDGAHNGALELDSFTGDGVRCFARLGGNWELAEADAVFAPSAWRHVACTYDGRALRVYGDGQLLDTRAVSGALGTTEPLPFVIGATALADGRVQNVASGRYDDVRIYDRALALEELRALAAR